LRSGNSLEIAPAPLVDADSYVEQGEFTFVVIVKNFSSQPVGPNAVKMTLSLKELVATSCGSNQAWEQIQICGSDPIQWTGSLT
jgi:hypothetical protein